MKILLLCLGFLVVAPATMALGWLDGGQLRGSPGISTWKEQRDRGIEKQDRDYSCGAASLATLMRGGYGVPVTEAEILQLLPDGTVVTSFKHLAELAETEWGLRATGLGLDFETLGKLRIPALVYMEVRGGGHFSVLRGVDGEGRVWLADPSWGNRLFSEHQFRKLWETRDHQRYRGRILLLQGGARAHDIGNINPDWFHRKGLEDEIRRSSCRNCRAGLI